VRVKPHDRLLLSLLGCLCITTSVGAVESPDLLFQGLDEMRSQIAKREFRQAESALDEYILDHPGDAEAWELLGKARHGRWDYKGAATAYRRALDLGRKNAGLLRGWVETKGRSSGNVSLVFSAGSLRKDLERALELDPLHVETRTFLAAFYYMVPRLLGGNREKADRLVSELVELSPSDGYYLLGVRAQEEDKPVAVVIGHLEKAVELDPMHTLALIKLGRHWLDRDDYERALPLYERAVESAPGDPRVFTSYGRALRRSGRPEESAAQYRRALEIDSFWADARFGLAEYFERIEDREAAIREYTMLARNNPTYRSKEIRKRLQKLIR